LKFFRIFEKVYNYPFNSASINFSGNERNGIEAVAKHPGLVHHVLRGAVDRDDLHLHYFIGWKNSSTIGSSRGAHLVFRLHLLHSDLLVGTHFKSFLHVRLHVFGHAITFPPPKLTTVNLNYISATWSRRCLVPPVSPRLPRSSCSY